MPISMRRLTTEEFIQRAKSVHGDRYDYSKVEYKNNNDKVCIICPIHGEFFQSARMHVNRKHGCPKCNGGIKNTIDIFIEKSKSVHGDKYNYDKFEYINNRTAGKIHCNTCGKDFYQRPTDHITKKSGCPYCRQSKMEEAVELKLEEYRIPFIYQANKSQLEWLKTDNGSFSLDFYFPQFSMAIECQGEQHFKKRERGIFTEEVVNRIIERDKEKLDRCLEHGVQIEYINYNEDTINKLNNILMKYTNELDTSHCNRD